MPSRFARGVLLGQLLALDLALGGCAAAELARLHADAPMALACMTYLTLGVALGWKVTWCGTAGDADSPPHHKCLAQSFIDVQASFLVIFAYQYTSITSVTLLGQAATPMVFALTAYGLGTTYRQKHYVGAALSVCGATALAVSDAAFAASGSSGANPISGDLLVLLSACFYSVSNVLTESIVSTRMRPLAFLGVLGCYGTVWAAAQLVAFRSQEFASLRGATRDHGVRVPLLAGAFLLSQVSFYVGSTWCIQVREGGGRRAGGRGAVAHVAPSPPNQNEPQLSGAAVLNLSLLATNLWAAIARVAFFGGFGPAYGACFVASALLTAGGLGVYTTAGAPGGTGSDVLAEDGRRLAESDDDHTPILAPPPRV